MVDNRPRTNQTSRGSARPGMPPLNFKTIKFLNNTEAIEVNFNNIKYILGVIFNYISYMHKIILLITKKKKIRIY